MLMKTYTPYEFLTSWHMHLLLLLSYICTGMSLRANRITNRGLSPIPSIQSSSFSSTPLARSRNTSLNETLPVPATSVQQRPNQGRGPGDGNTKTYPRRADCNERMLLEIQKIHETVKSSPANKGKLQKIPKELSVSVHCCL